MVLQSSSNLCNISLMQCVVTLLISGQGRFQSRLWVCDIQSAWELWVCIESAVVITRWPAGQ